MLGGGGDSSNNIQSNIRPRCFYDRAGHVCVTPTTASTFPSFPSFPSLPSLPSLSSPGTMSLRVRAQSSSALRLASFFQSHPRVAAVLYPGLQACCATRERVACMHIMMRPAEPPAARDCSEADELWRRRLRWNDVCAAEDCARCRCAERHEDFRSRTTGCRVYVTRSPFVPL